MWTRKERAGRALSSATGLIVDQFDDLVRAVYQAIDELQMRTIDVTLDIASLEAFSPRWVDAGLKTARDQCADTLRVFGSVRGVQLAYDEVVNKVQVLELVRQPKHFLGSGIAGEADVPLLIETVKSLPHFRRIWTLEGLGHDYTDWARKRGLPPRLLTDPTLPSHALPMMHAGLGVSVAEDILRGTTPYDSQACLE